MPHDVPLTVIEPELVVTLELFMLTPVAKYVPFAAVPVIVTLPVLVDVMLEDFR